MTIKFNNGITSVLYHIYSWHSEDTTYITIIYHQRPNNDFLIWSQFLKLKTKMTVIRRTSSCGALQLHELHLVSNCWQKTEKKLLWRMKIRNCCKRLRSCILDLTVDLHSSLLRSTENTYSWDSKGTKSGCVCGWRPVDFTFFLNNREVVKQ